MDPAYHPGFQQPVPGGTVGSMGYPPLPPPPLPPSVAPQHGYGMPYQPMLPYPPMMPQGYGQYPPYQGWGPYGPHLPALPAPPAPNTNTPPHPAPAPSTPQQYVNSQHEPGVWEFDVHVASDMAKSKFQAHTAMSWNKFEKEVLKQLDGAVLPVQLAYRWSGDIGKMSYLKGELDWMSTLGHLEPKITLARKNPAKPPLKGWKAGEKCNAKGKCRQETDDNDPPLVKEEVQSQFAAFKQLEATIKCEAHKGHCFMECSGGQDNHQCLILQEMTLWAQAIVRSHATVYCPPNTINFNCLSTKRLCCSHGLPNVHVAVNFRSLVPGAATLKVECPISPPKLTSSLGFNPPVCLLLELMDIDDPSPTFKYVHVEEEFRVLRVKGILDVYCLPQMVLATFGSLGWDGANHLHAYIKRWLMPLIKPGLESTGGEQEVVDCTQEVDKSMVGKEEPEADHILSSWKGKGWLLKEESKEVIVVWSSDEENEPEPEGTLPPIEVLDKDMTTEYAKSFTSAE
ncbi:hypothetical protein EI94DRAFT_1704899 [Lactarius quietus]|nr:hypothetical protein EI94DRAFT_1704899 [Lactarius quietus]